MGNDEALVSFIVVVNNDAPFEAVFKLLDSFYPQEGMISFEMLVVEKKDEVKARIYAKKYPWVELLQLEDLPRGSVPRDMALARARGAYIVFLEDHITVEKDYLKNVVGLFQKGYDGVAGPVFIGREDSASAWVEYFSEYHKWLPCRPEGPIDDLPGCGFAYRRCLLDELGGFPVGDFKLESLFNQRVGKKGYKLYFSHTIPARHFDDKTFPELLRYRFHYGRTFAVQRGFRPSRRLLYALLFPVIALIEYVRIARDVFYDEYLRKRFMAYSPWLLLTLFVWMFGESLGYLTKKETHVFIRSR